METPVFSFFAEKWGTNPLYSMSKILDTLFLGAESSVAHLETCKLHAVLTVQQANLHREVPKNINKYHIMIYDNIYTNVLIEIPKALEFINKNVKNGILVHCSKGISRSASIVLAYLMWKFQVTFAAALKFVEVKRQVYPNIAFQAQLMLFEGILQDALADKKKSLGSVLNPGCLASHDEIPLEFIHLACAKAKFNTVELLDDFLYRTLSSYRALVRSGVFSLGLILENLYAYKFTPREDNVRLLEELCSSIMQHNDINPHWLCKIKEMVRHWSEKIKSNSPPLMKLESPALYPKDTAIIKNIHAPSQQRKCSFSLSDAIHQENDTNNSQ